METKRLEFEIGDKPSAGRAHAFFAPHFVKFENKIRILIRRLRHCHSCYSIRVRDR